ncbi:MAG: hypothetical protein ACLVB4_07970 [Butyricicoccus sp.]
MSAMVNAMCPDRHRKLRHGSYLAPQDVQGESFDFPDYFFQKRVHHVARRVADDYDIEKAVEMIKASKKPMFIAGGGVRYSEAGRPQWTLQGVQHSGFRPRPAIRLPDSFELAVGGIGVTGGLAANALCKDCDLVIGVGTAQRLRNWLRGAVPQPDIKVLAINTSEFHAES